MKETAYHELTFCLQLRSQEGGCAFGGGTRCEQCAVPYLLLKLITGEILHGDMKRLSLEDWQQKVKEINI